MNKIRFLAFLFIIILVNILVWFKSFSLYFYNDDYQILSYLQENSVGNPFSVFAQKDVSNHYFRPIPNFINTVLLSIFGFHPLPFRISTFLLYLLSVVAVYIFLTRLFQNEVVGFLFALLFALLPSHDLLLVWLAAVGDTLTLLFIVLSFYFLMLHSGRYSFQLSLIFFVLSILSKESTILAPFFALTLSFFFKEKKDVLRRFTVFALIILILLFAYRFFVLQINIFSSPNISSISFGRVLKNFFLYPFIFVVPTFAYSTENTLGLLLNAILWISVLSLMFIYFFKTEQTNFQYQLFGLLWYFWFVIPALPLFMRWYSVLPSVGFILFIGELARKIKPKFLFSIIIPLTMIFSVVDYYSLNGWKKANRIALNIIQETSKIEPHGTRGILLWFFPQYYNNYPILRSGIQQAVNSNRNIKFEEVLLPVSIILNPKSSIKLTKLNDNEFLFTVQDAKVFINIRNKKFELKFQVSNDYYKLSLDYSDDYKNILINVVFLQYKPEYSNYYFDGQKFIKFY